MRIVVAGGGAAGGTAAQFARKTDRKAEITIIDSEPYGQYSRCALPYVLRGETTEEKIVEFSPEWFEKNGIKALYGWRVREVDFRSKSVEIEGDGEKRHIEYDSLIIATGARPWAPPIKGIESEGVFFLRTIEDVNNIQKWSEKAQKAAVVGAGLIGLEAAESLIKLGLEVEVLEFLPYPLPAMIDEDLAMEVDRVLREHGLKTHYSSEVTEIRGNPVKSLIVRKREGGETEKVDADMVIISTGNSPNTEIFQGVKKGDKGHIRVNERSETSIPDVYAAGDCTEYADFVTGTSVPMGMGTMAVRQGMAAGINAAGGDFFIHHYIGTRTTELFGKNVAAVGPTSHILGGIGKKYVSAKFRGKSLPEYFEGEEVYVKVMADKGGRLLAAQILGPSAPWRIAMLAEAMLQGDTVENLSKIETPYAPPVAPTLDASTIACSMAAMKLRRRK